MKGVSHQSGFLPPQTDGRMVRNPVGRGTESGMRPLTRRFTRFGRLRVRCLPRDPDGMARSPSPTDNEQDCNGILFRREFEHLSDWFVSLALVSAVSGLGMLP